MPFTIPLAALRLEFERRSTGPHWSLGIDGTDGRGLVVAADAPVSVRLRLGSRALFTGRVQLLPHDWRDGGGRVRAAVWAVGAAGRKRTLWSGELRSAARLGQFSGLRVKCQLPSSTTVLGFSVQALEPAAAQSVSRAVWLDATLIDPSNPVPTAPPQKRGVSPGTNSSRGPLVSVLTPVHDPPPRMLAETLESVRSQTYDQWELCLVDDGSSDPEVIAMLNHYAAADRRIRLERQEQAGGISSATNRALAIASGDYIALLDHDDTLVPDALERVAGMIADDPSLDMIYSDEDVLADDGAVLTCHRKPGWSPEHIALMMYTCHFGVYRRTLATDLGGFSSAFDGCQDYDFVLRLGERTDRIAHIPEVLYHWHAHSGSAAGGDQAKPYAYVAQPRAIAAHLQRTGVDAEVQFGPRPGLHQVVHKVDPKAHVSLVLAVDDDRGLAEAARSWVSQPHSEWDVTIAAPKRVLDRCVDLLVAAGVGAGRVTAVTSAPRGAPVTRLAAASNAAHGEYLLLMQRPVVGLTNNWMARLVGYSAQEQIGASGPIVLSPDGWIIEAGIALPEGIPIPLLHGFPGSQGSLVGMNVSAVSGVIATSARAYRALGGIDVTYGDLALIEYCLRAGELGRRIVTVPEVRVKATTSDWTTNDLPALRRLWQAWSKVRAADPFYNPHYRTDRGDFVPRATLA